MSVSLRLAAALLVAAGAVFAQQPIRVDVHLVNVAFSVRDDAGNLIDNLKQSDFEVLEDGVPQNISFFSPSANIPLHLGLVVDFSGSQEHFLKPHHRDMEAFLKAVLTARDRAFLLCFGNRLSLASDFTPSPKELVLSLELFEKGKRTFPEIGPKEIRPNSNNTAFFDAVYHSVTEMLDPIEGGRKALIVFSDGDDNTSARNMMETIELAQNRNVVLYSVRYTETDHGRLTARNKHGMSVMDRMAHETGGGHFDAQEKGLEDNFRQIGEQLRTSYELAYHSTNLGEDGTFHKILIRAKQPGLTVRAKTGYYVR